MSGTDVCSALMYLGPPTWAQGNTLTKSAPALHAVTISVGVMAPGNAARAWLWANSMIARLKEGEVRNPAPASTHFRAIVGSRTVPAPTTSFGLDRVR